MTRPSRNQPCPCGSGKKFKQCHGSVAQSTPSTEERAWRDLRRALDGFPDTMLRFVRQVYGVDVIHEAWAEFLVWPDDLPPFHADTPHMPLFMPWFFHQWAPDRSETMVEDETLHDRSPTSALLERRGGRLVPRLRRYLEQCADTPFSFHEIIRCEPGVGFRTRDIFTGTEHDVLERSASETFRVGDSFFGQVVTSNGVTLMEACGSYVIPPEEKIGLIELRQRMGKSSVPPTPETLNEWDIELRDAYLDIVYGMENRGPPALQNTDGEDVAFHTLSFEVRSAQGAFDALKHVAWDESEDELLESAVYDEEGRLRSVSLTWKVAGNRVHAAWDNTVLGNLEIDGTRLVANVNSAERAARLLTIVEECLGEDARHEGTKVESIEEALKEGAAAASPPAPSERSDPSDLSDHPEVRQRIRDLMSAHYESWLSEEIPALGGLSPLEAVQVPDGREKVAALVDQIERTGERMEPPLDGSIVVSLRERLGLK
jgi:hypothetical protein